MEDFYFENVVFFVLFGFETDADGVAFKFEDFFDIVGVEKTFHVLFIDYIKREVFFDELAL